MSDQLSQEDIDKLLQGDAGSQEDAAPETKGSESTTDDVKNKQKAAPAKSKAPVNSEEPKEDTSKPDANVTDAEPVSSTSAKISDMPSELKFLTEEEADALGEIGNISMGSSATTLSMLLSNKVDITTPTVHEYEEITQLFELPEDYLTVEIKYKEGLQGSSIFALNSTDSAIIADLMMGGDGKVEKPEIGELQLSAVGEAMNQMIGTSSTSLSSVLNFPIDITPPDVKFQKSSEKLDLGSEIFGVPVVAVAFKFAVGELIDSEMIQLMSLESAQLLVRALKDSMNVVIDEIVDSVPVQGSVAGASAPQQAAVSSPTPPPAPQPVGVAAAPPPPLETHQAPVTVQPVQFASFDDSHNISGEAGKNLDLLMDIKLKLSVELGKTELPIKKVLELTRGSVIELDKVAGEPVELFANGKLIAKGEVVVIEDNFGLRITSITSPDNRIQGL